MLVASIIITSISQVLLVLFVLSRDRRNLTNILFSLIGIASLGWALASYFSIAFIDSPHLLMIVRSILFFVVLQNTFFYLFAKTFPRETWSASYRWLSVYLFFSLLAAATTLSPFAFTDILVGDGPPNAQGGPGMLVFIAHAAFSSAAAFRNLGTKYKHSSGSTRRQLQILLIASILVWIVVPLTNFAVTPLLKTTFFVEFSPIYTFAFACIIGYAIVRHKLFDIKFAAVRSAAYILSIITLAAVYYLVAYLVSVTVFKGEISSTVSLSPINIAMALVLAFIFQPIKGFFDRITDKIFYRDRYNSDDFYSRLSELLTTTTDLRNLLVRVSNEIADTLKAEQAFFFVQYNHVHHVSAGTKNHSVLPLVDAHELNEYVKKNGDAIVVTELLPEHSSIQRLLISHKTAILMPLMRRSTVVGYLALGEQKGTGDYNGRDIKVLNTIADELVIAIQNALSVQEVKDINIHLQQRINDATKELKTKNTQLRHLDETKDEFLSMASHQLRTPLTSVKGYLSMVLEGDAGKISDAQKHLLGEAFTSSERMVHLIHDFLNVSRLQTGKFMIESKPVDLTALVENEVKTLSQVAAARNMQLEYTHSEDIPMLSLDETKMQQVVMNYIDNALYYSRPENPVVKIDLKRVEGDVELRVIDGGIGVPESEKEKLFGKFYRAGNARQKRPDGTGVGIYLAKKVIDATGGEIIFESEVGKGSTFGFSLPIDKLRATSEEKSD